MQDLTPKDFILRAAKVSDLDAVRGALLAAGLPVDGVEANLEAFFICERGGRFGGAAGLEVYGRDGLLRSVVVEPGFRRHGVGRQLCETVIAHAGSKGCLDVYLLTLDAAAYFERLGFRVVERDHAPPGIRASEEFSSLCPDTAVLMRRPVKP